MQNKDQLFKNIIAHSKEYGFVFPSSELYDGLGAVYDYGQQGVELKNNIKTYGWKAMVQMNENITGIDSALFMHPEIWKASGIGRASCRERACKSVWIRVEAVTLKKKNN